MKLENELKEFEIIRTMSKTLKPFSLLLAGLMFTCLLPMPYGYFQLIRFLTMICFGIFAYVEFNRSREILGITFIGLAILFQPIFKIALGRELWNIVDVVVGIGLILYGLSQSAK